MCGSSLTLCLQEVSAYTYLNQHVPAPIPMAKCIYKQKMTTADDGLLVMEYIEGKCVRKEFVLAHLFVFLWYAAIVDFR
jgi:hypothetical protein